jgi:hypothetical protein
VTATPRYEDDEDDEEERTELLYGVEDAVGRGDKFMKNVKVGWIYSEKRMDPP